MSHKKKIALILCAILVFPFIAQGIYSVLPEKAKAVVPFGGLVTFRLRCNCSVGNWVIVGPPAPAVVHVISGLSLIYPFRNYNVGRWVLGTHTGIYTAGCWRRAGKFCFSLPYAGTVIYMGTSQ